MFQIRTWKMRIGRYQPLDLLSTMKALDHHATPHLQIKSNVIQNILIFMDQGWADTPGPVIQPMH